MSRELGRVSDQMGQEGRINYRDRLYDGYLSSRRCFDPKTALIELQSRSAYLNKLVSEHFPNDRNSVILDIGCGHGALIYFARRLGYQNIRGIDVSDEQVALGRKLGILDITSGDLVECLSKMPTESCDTIVAFDVIEHFHKEEVVFLSDEVHRVLRPNGRWIIHVPNAESPFGGRILYGDLTHELAFTRESLTQLLMSCGFTTLRCFEDDPVCHGPKSVIRWLMWKTIRTALRLWRLAETGDPGSSAIFSENVLAVAVK